MAESQLFIGGGWCPAEDGRELDVIDPATGKPFHRVALAAERDVRRAVRSARDAFETTWGETDGETRAQYLEAMSKGIAERAEELATLEVRDNGKPLREARMDLEDTIACFDYYAALARSLDHKAPELIPLSDERFNTIVMRQPVGVVGQIVPWNYPILMAAQKVAPALAAGCTCVLKPSELTPLTALEMAKIADASGLPAGVLNVVTGDGSTGAALASHPDVDKVAFTGSAATGAKVMEACARDIKGLSLELGGKNPIIVFDDVDVDAAVEWIQFGIFWNQGEVCSATSRLLVQRNIADHLVERLVAAAKQMRLGPGMDPESQLGPLVSDGQHRKVCDYIQRGRQRGAKLLCGGHRPGHLPDGYFLEPTIFDEVPGDAEIWNEEIFGPVLCVRRFDTEDEALRMANDTSYGLAAAVLSNEAERCGRLSERLRTGIVWINCSQPAFIEAPWGGVKRSGFGRELGTWGLEGCLEVKQVTTYVGTERWGWYDG